jgi:transcriptional regulator with XRE-family HTH domain
MRIPKVPKNKIGARIYAHRMRNNLTLRRLGEMCGVRSKTPAQYMNGIEKGSRPLSKQMAEKMALVFDVTPESLLYPERHPMDSNGWCDR